MAANPPSAGCSAGSKCPQTLRCGPTNHRSLHIPSSPFASTPSLCLTFAAGARPVRPQIARALPGRSPGWLCPLHRSALRPLIRKERCLGCTAPARLGLGIRGLTPAQVLQVSPHRVRGLDRLLEFPKPMRAKTSSQRDFYGNLTRKSYARLAKGGGGIARILTPFSSPYLRFSLRTWQALFLPHHEDFPIRHQALCNHHPNP